VIVLKHLITDHSGLQLAEALNEVFEEFEITERLLGVTADNASNNSTMMATLEAN
jgi:hypothetical protein